MPLITKSDGTKFGKTESGTIWLDPARTSPYAFYQFWLGAADADVYKFLKYFTFLDVAEIDAIERADAQREGRPEAQAMLAREVTGWCMGRRAEAAQRITEALFSGSMDALSESDCAAVAPGWLAGQQHVARRLSRDPDPDADRGRHGGFGQAGEGCAGPQRRDS